MSTYSCPGCEILGLAVKSDVKFLFLKNNQQVGWCAGCGSLWCTECGVLMFCEHGDKGVQKEKQ